MWGSYIFRKGCNFWHSDPKKCQKRCSKIQKIWHQIHALYALRNFTHIYIEGFGLFLFASTCRKFLMTSCSQETTPFPPFQYFSVLEAAGFLYRQWSARSLDFLLLNLYSVAFRRVCYLCQTLELVAAFLWSLFSSEICSDARQCEDEAVASFTALKNSVANLISAWVALSRK